MFRHLTVSYKLIFLTLVVSLPVAILLYLLVKEQNIAIDFAQQERKGVEYLKPVRQLMHDFQLHQVAFLTNASDLSTYEQRLEADFKAIQTVDARHGRELKTGALVQGIIEKWHTKKSLILRASSGAPTDTFRAVYEDLITKDILPLIIQVGNTSNLILDPDLDSYYAMDTVVTKLPEFVQLLGQAHAHALGLLMQRTDNTEKKQFINYVLARVEPALDTMYSGLQTAMTENSALSAQLSAPMRANNEAMKTLVDTLRRNVLGAGPAELARVNLDSFKSEGAKTLAASYSLYDASVDALDSLLANRIAKFNQRRTLSLGIVAVSILLSMLFMTAIMRSIAGPINRLTAAAGQLTAGATNVPIDTDGKDEIGQLARAIVALAASQHGGGKEHPLRRAS